MSYSQKRCGKECQKFAQRRYQLAYRTAHADSLKEYKTAKTRESRRERRKVSPPKYSTPQGEVPSKKQGLEFTRCYECCSAYQIKEMLCPDCGAPYDKTRCLEAVKRSQKTYKDIVRENAVKAGKDPKEELTAIRRRRSFNIGTTAYTALYKQIAEWQRKRRKKKPLL